MKYLIIGDSHTLRLRNSIPTDICEDCHFDIDGMPLTSKCKEPHVSKMPKDSPVELYFSGHRGKTAYRGSFYENDWYPCLKQFQDSDFTILPWFGYIDVKQFLPVKGFRNPEEAVISYMDRTSSYFENNKIRYIEPLPQFTNILGFGSPLLSFEEREPYQKEFIKYLRIQSKIRGLEDPISVKDILGIDKLDESYECGYCDDCLTDGNQERIELGGYKLDHPKKEYYTKIINSIIKELTNNSNI